MRFKVAELIVVYIFQTQANLSYYFPKVYYGSECYIAIMQGFRCFLDVPISVDFFYIDSVRQTEEKG